jgi:hypothetical protein
VINRIGIFTGKQEKNNKFLLMFLFDNGPLSAWGLIPSRTPKGGKASIHAIFNKRLRSLEKKGYVSRNDEKWFLSFKGILAVLLNQKEPKMWSPIWTELFKKSAKTIEENSEQLLGVEKSIVQGAFKGFKSLGLFLDDFSAWINLSNRVKDLMKKGVINFDVISEETLFMLISTQAIMEKMGDLNLEQLSVLFKETRD